LILSHDKHSLSKVATQRPHLSRPLDGERIEHDLFDELSTGIIA